MGTKALIWHSRPQENQPFLIYWRVAGDDLLVISEPTAQLVGLRAGRKHVNELVVENRVG